MRTKGEREKISQIYYAAKDLMDAQEARAYLKPPTSDFDVEMALLSMPLEYALRWCETTTGCACIGCANCTAELKDKAQWQRILTKLIEKARQNA